MQQCIFIGGAARTGTTLLQAIFCTHPSTNPLLSEAAAVRHLVSTYRLTCLNTLQYPGMYFDDLSECKAFFQVSLDRFLKHLFKRFSCRALVLKEPELTKYFNELVELNKTFNLQFIVLVRDPRDIICSLLDWGERASYAGQTHQFQLENLDKMIVSVNDFYKRIYKIPKNILDEQFCFIRYEDLVCYTNATLNQLTQFTGLRFRSPDHSRLWERSLINFKDENLPMKNSITRLYGQPISNGSVNHYREKLSSEQIERIEKGCSVLMNKYGYKKSTAIISEH